MDLASVVAALASVGVRVSGSTPNNNIQGDSSRACPTGLAGPEPSGTHNDPGQHFQPHTCRVAIFLDIFLGRLPPRRPHWSLALLLASGDQTRGPAGPSDLTDGAEAQIGPFSPWAWKHNNSRNSNEKKLFRVSSKPKGTNSSRLQPLPGCGGLQMASSSLWSSPRGRDRLGGSIGSMGRPRWYPF